MSKERMAARGVSTVTRCRQCFTIREATRESRRKFTSSASQWRHGAVPAFTATSSPELDDLLTTLRNKVFLPAHLSKEQRNLIYKSKYARSLEVEPVIAKIANDEFRLQHIDKTKDILGVQTALEKAMDLMKDKKDWDNLPSLLHGIKNVGTLADSGAVDPNKNKLKKNKYHLWTKLARKAAQGGRLDVILECARRVSDTGFGLNHPETVNEIFWRLQDKALASDWSAKETKQVLAWAEMFFDMLEDERHAGSRFIKGYKDPRAQPQVIGLLLQLAAVRAEQHLDGKDEDGKVAKYAERLVALPIDLELGSFYAGEPTVSPELAKLRERRDETLESGEEFSKVEALEALESKLRHDHVNHWLSYFVPILHGMKTAKKVLDPTSKLATELDPRIQELERLITEQVEILVKHGKFDRQRGLMTYKKYEGDPESS